MKFNGCNYVSNKLGSDFVFAVMWHISPARSLDVTIPQDVILAVNNAYRDMMPRTIDGLGLSKLNQLPAGKVNNSDKTRLRKKKDDLLGNLKMNLATNIVNKVFQANCGNGVFDDRIHEELCDDFIVDFKGVINQLNQIINLFNAKHSLVGTDAISHINSSKITYGKAQKIVNMTMKQLYCFDNAATYKTTVFEKCHIPIDSVILGFFGLSSSYVWSNLDKQNYQKVQSTCKREWSNKVNVAKLLPTDDMRCPFFAEFVIWDARNRLGCTVSNIDISP